MVVGVLCVWFNGRSRQERSEQCRLNSQLVFQLVSSENGPSPWAPTSAAMICFHGSWPQRGKSIL